MHEFPWDDVPTGVSLVDLNRAGTPLIEIVTEPDLALARGGVRLSSSGCAGSCAGSAPPTGTWRRGPCAATRTSRSGPTGARALGTKVEIKNLNSIAHVKKALEHEIERQAAVLSRPGGAVVQETRLFEPATRRDEADAVEGRGDGLPLLPRPRPRRRSSSTTRGTRRSRPRCPSCPGAARRAPRGRARPPGRRRRDALCRRVPSPTPSRRPSPRTRRTRRGSRTGSSRDLLARMTDADRQEGRIPVAPGTLARPRRADRRRDDLGEDRQGAPSRSHRDRTARVDDLDPGEGARPDDGRGRDPRRRRGGPRGEPGSRSPPTAAGRPASFGWFVGQVMKATGGKASPAVVNRLLREAARTRVIEFYRVAKEYQGRRVLKNLSFQVAAGRVRLPDGALRRREDDAPEAPLPRRGARRGPDHRERDERRRRCRRGASRSSAGRWGSSSRTTSSSRRGPSSRTSPSS